MSTDIAVADGTPRDVAVAEHEEAGYAALAHVLGSGDLAQLTNEERVGHYLRLCRSLGLNPLSRPFDWIFFKEPGGDEKLALYPNQSCAAQLRRQHHMRVEITRREIVGELFVCEAKAHTPDGREDVSSKYVPLVGKYGKLQGSQLANAMMKAETGAKRRVTLSMVGLASPPDADETTVWRPVVVDGRGTIVERPTEEQKALAADPKLARVIGEPIFEDTEIGAEDLPSQAVRTEELERPQRPAGPRPSFRPSDEDVKRWQGAWFAAVRGLSLDTDEARHAFVQGWTRDELGWPEGKATDSLRTMFARMTEREAGDFLAHVRALMEDEKRELLAQSYENMPDPEPLARPNVDQRVHGAVQLTGGPAVAETEPFDEDAGVAF